MPTLTQQQIVQVARAGGLPGDPQIWAAVAMAESSGRTDVVNGIGAVGLWQINQPVHVKEHPTWTVAYLQNPVNNARAAATVYRKEGWNAWEAYTGPDGKGSDGPWRQFYKPSSSSTVTPVFDWNDPFNLWPDAWGDAPGSLGGDTLNDWGNTDGSTSKSIAPGISDVATGIGTIAEAVQKTAAWLGNSKNWVRIGYIAGGGVLVLLGLSIVAKPLVAGTPVAKGATIAKKAIKAKNAARKQAKAAKKTESEEEEEGGEDDDE